MLSLDSIYDRCASARFKDKTAVLKLVLKYNNCAMECFVQGALAEFEYLYIDCSLLDIDTGIYG